MQTSDTFFFYDGTKVVGSHTAQEISEMFHKGLLKEDSQVCTANDHGWKALKDFPELTAKVKEKSRVVVASDKGAGDQEVTAKAPQSEEDSSAPEDDDEDGADGEKRFTPIRSIRSLFNDLWEAQRESIIARIKNEELDDRYEKKRKEHLEIKSRVEAEVLEYWRKSGVLDDWIKDMIWEGKNGERGDYRKKLKQADLHGNFERAMKWLDESGLGELAGVYSFRNGKKRIYIGQTDNLGRRLKQLEGQFFWGEATELRILIPKHKASTMRLERLMILRHQPERNRNDGNSKVGSEADEVLDFIISEIKDLLTDG